MSEVAASASSREGSGLAEAPIAPPRRAAPPSPARDPTPAKDPAQRVRELIERGRIVCPDTRQPLVLEAGGSRLRTADGRRSYAMVDGVPVLMQDHAAVSVDAAAVQQKFEKKAAARSSRSLGAKLERLASRGHRTRASRVAFERLFADRTETALLVNLGGGPSRIRDTLNLNFARLQNVDVVGDAQRLPFADGTVDGILCEAVLEHLPDAVAATAEMFRVLRSGARVFACTPFLQNYHGYPHHYQNFTHTGHAQLFAAAGFRVEECGVANGPLYTLLTLNALFIRSYFPKFCARWLSNLFRYATAPLRPLDRRLGRHPKAFLLASTTYVLAVKP